MSEYEGKYDMLTETLDCRTSSNLRWARYNPATKVLEVDFKNKTGDIVSTYAYDGFPADGWTALQASPSPGKFFSFHIRPHFTGRRLGEPLAAPPLFASVVTPSFDGLEPEAPKHPDDSLFAITSTKA